MSEERDIYELIDRYLKDELDRDELDIFRNRMRNDEEFAREVELHRALVEEINEARKQELKRYLNENAKVEYIGNIWGKTWLYASAAVIVLMIGAFFVIQQLNSNGPIAQKDTDSEASQEEIADMNRSANMGSSADSLDSLEMDRIDSGLVDVEQPLATTPVPERKPSRSEDELEGEHLYKEMGEEERQLEAKDISDSLVRTDKRLASTQYTVKVISMVNQANRYLKNADQVATSQSDKEESNEKKRGIFRRSKEEEPSEQDDESRALSETTRETSSRNIDVEYWTSPVNFKGYKYDGFTLHLYGVNPSESIEFVQYNSRLYMRRGGQYYSLAPAEDYKKFVKLTDSAIIKELNR